MPSVHSKVAFVDCGLRGCEEKTMAGSLYCALHQAGSSVSVTIVNNQRPSQEAKPFVRIPLTGAKGEGKFALVDEEDYEKVMAVSTNWNLDTYGYASTKVKSHAAESGWTAVKMHQVVTGERGWDHISRDGLDNRRVNLRPLSQSGQQRNRRPRGASRFPGVCRYRNGKWRARIRDGEWVTRRDGGRHRKNRSLGTFSQEKDAARAYRDAALKLDPLLNYDVWSEL